MREVRSCLINPLARIFQSSLSPHPHNVCMCWQVSWTHSPAVAAANQQRGMECIMGWAKASYACSHCSSWHFHVIILWQSGFDCMWAGYVLMHSCLEHLDDVIQPKWASAPDDLIRQHRAVLMQKLLSDLRMYRSFVIPILTLKLLAHSNAWIPKLLSLIHSNTSIPSPFQLIPIVQHSEVS